MAVMVMKPRICTNRSFFIAEVFLKPGHKNATGL
jgi:hypothetical protein